jgi:hypothetical protein
MRPYQTLSLIGCIIGIFLMMGLYGLMGIGTVFNNVALNMTKTLGNSSQLALQQQRHDATEASWKPFIGGVAFSLLLYIAAIPITFIIRKTKAVWIVLIIIGVIAIASTNGWGIIPFALILPAGIVAIRTKQEQVNEGAIKT